MDSLTFFLTYKNHICIIKYIVVYGEERIMNQLKHLILTLVSLLILGVSVANAEQILPKNNYLPAQMQKIIFEEYPQYNVESHQEVYGTPEGDHFFVLIKSSTERRLLCFQPQDEAWKKWLDVKDSVPQTDLPVYLTTRSQGESYQINTGHEKYDTSYVSDGFNLLLIATGTETYEETAFFQWRDGSYHLMEYSKRTQLFVHIIHDEFVFSNLGSGFDGYALYPLDTDIRSVNFDQLPATLHELPTLHDFIPIIACEAHGFPPTALSLQNVAFPVGKKYDVYMGPGKHFGRSGNGKAVVSTNDWIQVFGEYDGWLLIQYGISEGKFRIGWIRDEALPKGTIVSSLNFSTGSQTWLEGRDGSYQLTDDPLGARSPIVTIKGLTAVEMLARLGTDWVYIRVKYNGATYYGFIPAEWIQSNG
ncbi:MAG: hypothetical protein E7329_00460 [Clostridiales bacterium]|nr:hypothetical protein [Clostridiales bacterium]